jgi:hypothetical protein
MQLCEGGFLLPDVYRSARAYVFLSRSSFSQEPRQVVYGI